jgi:predicted dehydrogenase
MAVGIGIVGLGWWGRALAKSTNAADGVEVAAGFARSPDTRAAFAADYDCKTPGSLEELLADPDVEGILVATPHSTHLEIVEAAAAAGKAVFMEKPLALTKQAGEAIVTIATGAGIPLQVGHQRRRSAANRAIKKMIDAGDIGTIQMAEANQSIGKALTHPDDAWRRDRSESPLGGMTSLGVHKVDTLHYLVGPMKRVAVFTKNEMDRPEIDEATVVAIEFESGAVGTLVTSFVVPMISRVGIYGMKASAYNDFDGTALEVQKMDEGRVPVALEPVDPVVDQLVEFGKVVRGEMDPETGGAEGLAVVSVLEAMVESSETRRAVEVRY